MRILEPEERGIFKEIKRALLLLFFFPFEPNRVSYQRVSVWECVPCFQFSFLLSSCIIGMLVSSGSLEVILS